MDLYGCHFEYAGELSRKYGLIIASVDTERNMMISGKVESLSVFNKRGQFRHHIGSNYSEAPLSFEMEVVSESPISGDLRRRIQKWLFNQSGYQRLYIDRIDEICDEVFGFPNGYPRRSYLNCRFVNPEKIEDLHGIVGFKFTVECDSNMAWQDPIKTDLSPGDQNEFVMEVELDTDHDDYTYPKIAVSLGILGGDLSITNLTDNPDRETLFVQMPPGADLVINGAYNYVSGGYYENFTYRNFPRLLDGKNELLIRGNISLIEIEWQNKRYL